MRIKIIGSNYIQIKLKVNVSEGSLLTHIDMPDQTRLV